MWEFLEVIAQNWKVFGSFCLLILDTLDAATRDTSQERCRRIVLILISSLPHWSAALSMARDELIFLHTSISNASSITWCIAFVFHTSRDGFGVNILPGCHVQEDPMYSLYDYIQLRTNYFEHWVLNYIRTQKSSTFKAIKTRDIRGSRFETRSSRNYWHSRLSIRDWGSSRSSLAHVCAWYVYICIEYLSQ